MSGIIQYWYNDVLDNTTDKVQAAQDPSFPSAEALPYINIYSSSSRSESAKR